PGRSGASIPATRTPAPRECRRRCPPDRTRTSRASSPTPAPALRRRRGARERSWLGGGELDLRRFLGRRRRLEELIFLEAEQARRDVRGKLPARRVVGLHRLVVAHPLDGDPVLRAGELVHQTVERVVRLELRVVLDDD